MTWLHAALWARCYHIRGSVAVHWLREGLHIIYLVGAVLCALALQVAGEVSVFTVLHNHHQWACRAKRIRIKVRRIKVLITSHYRTTEDI